MNNLWRMAIRPRAWFAAVVLVAGLTPAVQADVKPLNDAVKEPAAVRYAWADNPVCNMYSVSGLPLTPFRTDDWPGVTATAK
jgi:hypothetical protein